VSDFGACQKYYFDVFPGLTPGFFLLMPKENFYQTNKFEALSLKDGQGLVWVARK
jgi:hypothetical protein